MLNLYDALIKADFYKKVTIKGMLCVEYKCLDQRPQFNFWIDCGCLIYCTAGKKIYRANAQDFEVEKGSVFYMKKGAYTGKNFLDAQYCALMFFLPDEYISAFLLRHPDLKLKDQNIEEQWMDGIIPVDLDDLLDTYFLSVLNYFSKSSVRKELLEVKLEELVLNLFTVPIHQSLAAYLSFTTRTPLANLVHVVEENFASSMKLKEYAVLCNMSLSTFKREFVKVYHEAPGVWLLKRKLELARSMLQHSDDQIGEISFRCGFESASHFSRVFKEAYAVTPGGYRSKAVG